MCLYLQGSTGKDGAPGRDGLRGEKVCKPNAKFGLVRASRAHPGTFCLFPVNPRQRKVQRRHSCAIGPISFGRMHL